VFSDGEGELNDAAAALDWLQSSQYVTNSLWVAGFSFGAWIAMQLLMRRPELEKFVIVSPPTGAFDFSFLAPCPVSGQIIYGKQDKAVSRESVDSMVKKIQAQRGLNICYDTIEDANHSFEGCLDGLNASIQKYVAQELTEYKRASAIEKQIAS
jgi:alpha/beta superfamily hydrolase